jgi:hypothetical protein
MTGFLPSAVFLGIAAVAALTLTRRSSPSERVADRTAASRVLALALAAQTLHFLEEAATGFPERFGPLLGAAEMPPGFFLAFNLAWIGIWGASVWGIRSARGWALFAAWFLAIAGTLNAVAHPLLALASGGYFPGLISSPFVGAASLWLWVRLVRMTGPPDGPDEQKAGRPTPR